jgi:anti-sigma regulatory factor (Ser/Thr protein kinase)
MTSQPATTIERSFAKDIGSIQEIFKFVEKFVESNSLDESIAYTIRFGVEELFTNMVKYNPLKHDVTIRCARMEEQVVITLIDVEAKPFDITARKELDLTQPLEHRSPGGLGIHLLKKMMDKMEYSHDGIRSTITFTILLN